VNEAQVVGLSAIAGLSILLGIALGRRLRASQALLTSLACGVLIYLLGDMLARSFHPINAALLRSYDNLDTINPALWLSVLFIVGLLVGYGGLAGYFAWAAPSRLVVAVAIGIGLHNFGEGMALGTLAGQDWVSISVVLVAGYLLQNLVEGCALVAPLAGVHGQPRHRRHTWPFLLLVGLIAGLPTLAGSYLGWRLVDTAGDDQTIAMIGTFAQALAAGAILFVLLQLLSSIGGIGHRMARHAGLLIGLLAALATEILIIGATGA
jgi:ZIP family zinc transporter